jgi:uncharacterized protein YjbJ (UPF0337 family)
MGLQDRAKASAKNVEGKAQEVLGNITGDPKDQMAGKAKQAQAGLEHAVEDVKEKARDIANG